MPQLEFHQLDRRLENLRLRHPSRQRRLIASLAESGQQTPIIVIEQSSRYLVIDGHKRIAALQQLGRDTVEAVVWAMSEADALVLERTLVMGEAPCAIEQGWLLQEMESRLGYSIEDLARRFDHSRHWVASRLALVETLPASVQQWVREGKLSPSLAMRYLVPVARSNREHCQRMAAAFVDQAWTTRQAGAFYQAWRRASGAVRERLLSAVRKPDRTFALALFARGVTLDAVENALVLAVSRRLVRPPDAPPLGVIRSLAYFGPVIEEVMESPAGPDYYRYLRQRMHHWLATSSLRR